MPNPNPTLRDEDCCPDMRRYADGKAPDTYFGAVGGWEALWHVGWVDRVEGRARGSARRWKVLGHLQVAQAVLAQPAWPIEDAVCALKWAVHHYRRWAEDTGRVGAARDAHDIARYLYHPRVTQDGRAFLRPGLGAQEEAQRRAFALRVLRVAQCDVARWLEATSPMTHRAVQLSTALRVPGLPINWRINPYVPDWTRMPYGFTRPLVALEMVAAGIVKFPYTFTKHDPTLRDWPRQTDLVDDVVDAVSAAWNTVVDAVSDAADWVCRNSEFVSAAVTGVAVTAEIVATGGVATPEAVSTAYTQYAAVQTGLSTVCGGIAAVRAVDFLLDWDGQVAHIAKSAAEANALPVAVAAVTPRGRQSDDQIAEALRADALRRFDTAARPLVEGLLRSFQTALKTAAANAGGEVASAFLKRFDDWDPLVRVVVEKAKREATTTIRQYVALRVANLRSSPSTAPTPTDKVLRQVYKDVAAIQATTGPQTSTRDAARRQVLVGRGEGYGGPPATVFDPVELSAPVQNAQMVGLPVDAINELLYGPGPQDDGIRPTLRERTAALTSKMVLALTGGGASLTAPFVSNDEFGAIRAARVALRVARAARVAVDFPTVRVVAMVGPIVYAPRTMISAPVSPYPVTFGPTLVLVAPPAAETMYKAIAREDAEAFVRLLQGNAQTRLNLAFVSRAVVQHAAAARRRNELEKTKQKVDARGEAANDKRLSAKRKAHAAEFKRSRQKQDGGVLPYAAGAAALWLWLK